MSFPKISPKKIIRKIKHNFFSSVNSGKFSETLLKKIIEIHTGLKKDKIKNDFSSVCVLREWAHENILWGERPHLVDEDKKFYFYYKNAPEIFSAFFEKKGGVMCGGGAYALSRLYSLYGIESYVLDVGKVGINTHAVVLVRVLFNGKSLLCLQDPMCNLSMVDENQDPLDYFDLLENMCNKMVDKKNILYGKARSVLFLGKDKEKEMIINLEDEVGSDFLNFLEKCFLPKKPYYIFSFPISILSFPVPEKDNELIKKACRIISKLT